MAAVQAFKPRTLTQQVATLIRERIMSGELPPGERIVEQTLARLLGVGQNVVREALIELAHRGFVRRITNRGTYVTKLSMQEALKFSQVRAVLESLAVELVYGRLERREIDLSSMRDAAAQMRQSAEAGNREQFYDHDIAFHEHLWSLADNECLAQTLEQVAVPLFAAFIVLHVRRNEAVSTLVEAVEAHEKVLDDLEHGSQHAACQAIRELADLSLKQQRGLISGLEQE